MAALLVHRVVDAILAEDAPQADADTGEAGEEGQIVGGAVAGQSVGALAVTILADNRVVVVYGSVEEVEDVSTENRGQCHHTPVLGKTSNAEGLRGQRRENTKQEAVGDTRQSGDDD